MTTRAFDKWKVSLRIDQFKSGLYFYQIDTLRGIAALLVVLYHFILGNPHRFSELRTLQYFASFGHLGVQVFFVISGFVIPNSMKASGYRLSSFGKFLLKRLVRLEPPYLISVLLCLILLYVSWLSPLFRGTKIPVSWQQVLLHLGYLNTFFHYDWLNVVYWTLAIEFQYYLLIALVYPVIESGHWYKQIFLALSIIILAWFFPQKEFFFRHAPYFAFGVFLFLLKSGRVSVREMMGLFLVTLVVCIVQDGIAYAMFGAFAFFFILFSRWRSNVGIYLGSISYSLYLLHVPIGQRILNLCDNFVHNQYEMFVVVLFCIGLMILISHFYFKLIERPSQRFSKKITL